jgi:hypothetical protein
MPQLPERKSWYLVLKVRVTACPVCSGQYKKMLTSYAVLELGSGTGLVGIAAAAVWGLDVTLTDLEDVKDNLRFNTQENSDKVVEVRGGHVTAEILDWNHPDESLASCPTKEFEVRFRPICHYSPLTSIAGHCCRLFLR